MKATPDIVSAKPLTGYRIAVEFADGVCGVVSLRNKLWGEMFAPLQDADYFARLFVDAFGVICWPNGADLAPDAIYRRFLRARKAARNRAQSASVSRGIKRHAVAV